MKKHLFALLMTTSVLCCAPGRIYSDNQTCTVSPVYSGGDLPFQVQVEQVDFELPNGLQSFVSAVFDGKWVLLAGRTNGLHGFENSNDNFPPRAQNAVVYVVDPVNQTVAYRSLHDVMSGLSRTEVDELSVTSPEFYQDYNTLYIVGGYGVDSATGLFSTKDRLTAINIPGLIEWVTSPRPGEMASQHIRFVSNPIFRVTGGYLTKGSKDEYLLIFGQDFEGYYTDTSSGQYIQKVQRFHIHDHGSTLSVHVKVPHPLNPDPNYRRRDLNVVPIINPAYVNPQEQFVAFSGVFTLTGGAWTVPVMINTKGEPSMPNPNDPSTFKQAMNNYACPTVGMYSQNSKNMYIMLFGGISYGYFKDGICMTDGELPFINQITTIQLDQTGNFSQYIMDSEYPVILSTCVHPGNCLRFGAGAQFIPVNDIPMFDNGVLDLDQIGNDQVLLGYIVGGIQSTVDNTTSYFETAASPYIFSVVLQPNVP